MAASQKHDKYSHVSHFTKHIPPLISEGENLLQHHKWWYETIYAYLQYLSTYNLFTTYKELQETEYNISKYVLRMLTHTKIYTATENYQESYRALQVNQVKDTTINSSTAKKSHIKFGTYMNNDNWFDLLVAVVFGKFHISEVIFPLYFDKKNMISYLLLLVHSSMKRNLISCTYIKV